MPVYKNINNNSWYFRVYVVDNNIKKQKKKMGFKTKSEAKKAESEFLLNYTSLNDNIRFYELYTIYIKHKRQTLKYQSYKSIVSRFENYILPFFKDYKINSITLEDIINWKNYILDKNFSYTYNKNLYISLVNILNFACDFYNLKQNVASKAKNFNKNNYKSNIDYWTYEEFNKFISYVDDKIYFSLFNILYRTGMRLGECLALTWDDIDFNNKTININKTLAKNKNNNDYIITTPKTNSSIRNISLDDYSYKVLIDLKSHYKSIVNFNTDWFVFGGIYPLSQTTIGRKKNEYCKIANVKQIRIHDFRHSHASLLLSLGVKISVISERLGHSNISTTLNVYSHLMPKDRDDAVNILNNLNNKI